MSSWYIVTVSICDHFCKFNNLFSLDTDFKLFGNVKITYILWLHRTQNRMKVFLKLTQGFLKPKPKGEGVWCLVLRNFNDTEGDPPPFACSSPPDLPPYLQGSNGTAGCQVQVLSQVEIISKHGQMSCQKIVVFYSLQIKAVLMRTNTSVIFFF